MLTIVHFLTLNDLWLLTNGQKINVFLLKMLTLFQGGNFRFKTDFDWKLSRKKKMKNTNDEKMKMKNTKDENYPAG